MRADYQRQWEGEAGYLVRSSWKPKKKRNHTQVRNFLAKTARSFSPDAWDEEAIELEVTVGERLALAEIEQFGIIAVETGTVPCENWYDIFGWEGGTNDYNGGWYWPYAPLHDKEPDSPPPPRRLTWIEPEDEEEALFANRLDRIAHREGLYMTDTVREAIVERYRQLRRTR